MGGRAGRWAALALGWAGICACADGGALSGVFSAQVGASADARPVAPPAGDAGVEADGAACRPERCDGQDDDCDGVVDEDACAACAPGDFAPCYDGDADTLNVGVCRAGLQRCGDEGRLLPCGGQILPGPEVCNSADDDCDGRADEDFAEQVGQPCTVGIGACAAAGTFLCDADGQRCAGLPGSVEDEVCNGVDDDCDGLFDEGFGLGEPCAVGIGACRREGLMGCGDAGGACQARPGLPTAELCNGLDDDCDGATDEGEASCYTGPDGTQGVGRCRSGRGICGGACEGELLPADEACNGQDDDCDGEIDNRDRGCSCDPGMVVDCFEGEGRPGIGRCREGRRTCDADHTFGPCVGQVGPADEACNGEDDDCDGAVDESLAQACGADIGRCRQGQQACARGRWQACEGAIGPAAEACNGVDDDCDGAVDEALTRPCGQSVGACRTGTQRCEGGGWTACEGGVGPAGEQCNRADDDCDGATDEGVTNACGGCGALPTEACDGVDQDCDGRVDEQVVGPVPAEACNGRDDDCDGRADEGLGADCRPCAAAADCNDANPCTDDRCQAGRCVFTNNAAACDDGVFCNGDDTCSGGSCAVHGERDCGRDVCSPMLDRCVQCIQAADCAVPGPGPFGPCAYPTECAAQGVQERVVDEPRCADGFCEVSRRVEQQACQRAIEGAACSAGVCLAGVCTPQRTITARLAGDFAPAGRARVACAQGGQACVATWATPCSVACPEGTGVIACCSNGSACGGNPQGADFNILLVQITLAGLVEPMYAPFAPGQDQEAHATGTVGAGAGTLECGYFNINIPFP